MSDDVNGVFPAFPTQALNSLGEPSHEHCPGLTKRELFAAKAMQSLLTPVSGDDDPQLWSYTEIATCAVKSPAAIAIK